jgi:hypothetical protein
MVHSPAGSDAWAGQLTMAVDRISQRGSIAAPATSPNGGPAGAPSGGQRFESLLAQPEPPAAPETAIAAPLSAAALVQAQVEDVFARQRQDKEARRHGMAMLKALGAVQLAMLGSDDDSARQAITTLADAVRNTPPADDAVLRLILREIGIRAAVELARGPGLSPVLRPGLRPVLR